MSPLAILTFFPKANIEMRVLSDGCDGCSVENQCDTQSRVVAAFGDESVIRGAGIDVVETLSVQSDGIRDM